MKEYNLYEASRSLGNMNLNIGNNANDTENFWCRVVFAEKEIYNLKSHRHSFFELHLCLAESGVFEICGKEIVLLKNQYLLVAPSTEHRIVSQPRGYRKFIWAFRMRDERVETKFSENCPDYMIGEASEDILRAVDIILYNAYKREFGYYNIIKGQLSYIFALIVRDGCDIGEVQGYGKKPSLVVKEIKRYIADNLRNNPSPRDISAQFSKSVGWMDKICKSQCGFTIASLKRQVQLEKIKEMLVETDLNLDTISDICGFSDRFSMGKFFKKHEGMPPGEYRRSDRR